MALAEGVIPLYQKVSLTDVSSPRLQIPDKLTAEHFFEGGYHGGERPVRVDVTTLLPGFRLLTTRQLELFIPERKWFYNEGENSHADGIHGIPHESRVGLYSYLVAQKKGHSDRETLMLLAASLMHDIDRQDDRVDPDHGKRSAQAIKFTPQLLQDLRERGIDLTPQEITAVRILCRFHEVPYEKVPKRIQEKYGNLLQSFMIADALDRYRTPSTKWWPDSNYFSHTPESQALFEEMMPFAKFFTLQNEVERTHHTPHVKDSLIKTGRKVGLVETRWDETARHVAQLNARRSLPFSGA